MKNVLHDFVNAIKIAYAHTYVHSANFTGSQLYADSSVASVKPVSLPRLEVNVAVMSSLIHSDIANRIEIPVEITFPYIDSKIVLACTEPTMKYWAICITNRADIIVEHSSVQV